MKNNKYVLGTLIALIFVFTPGWKWKDVEKDYGNYLKSGISCEYNLSEQKGPHNLEFVAFVANESSINIQFNESLEKVFSSKGYEPSHYKYFYVPDYFTNEFLKKYKDNEGKCPNSIYIDYNDLNFQMNVSQSSLGRSYYTYSLKPNTIISNDGVKKDCHTGEYEAVDCKRKTLQSNDDYNLTIYIEYGYYKKNNKNVPYFGIGNNTNSVVPTEASNGEFQMKFNGMYNIYVYKDSAEKIFINNSSLLDSNDLKLSKSIYSPNNYYISTGDSITPGEESISTTVEDSANMDEVYERKNYTVLTIPDIPELNCTSLLGDPLQGPDKPSPAYLLTYAFKIIRYVALILLVVLSIMDFVSSISSQDKDSINKAVNKTIQRAIICVIIFLLPSIIEFVLTFLNDRAVNICINS